MLNTYDELPHQALSGMHWRESWYLNFFDHDQELYGVAWMGIRPNVTHGEIMFALCQGNQFLHLQDDFDIPISRDIGRERVGFGPLSFTVLRPYRHWRIDYSQDSVEVSLEWRALSPVYNWEWQETAHSWHYEHPGRITGRISVGDKSFDFNGLGVRDRAWGQRDNRYFEAVHWTVAQFENGLFFNSMVVPMKGRTHLYGYVQDDGETSLLTDLTLETSYAYPGGPPASATLFARDELGRDFEIHQEIINVIPFVTCKGGAETRQYFTFKTFSSNGARGMGMVDHWWSRFESVKTRYVCDGSNHGRLFPLELCAPE